MSAVDVLDAGGLGMPDLIVEQAQFCGLELAGAAALVQKETGGRNIYGHDPVNTGGTYTKGGLVTRDNYLAFRAWQRGGPNRMQGVGPVQLTYYTFQDQADALGGCWDPRNNLNVGFSLLASLQAAKGEWAGAKAYNGSGTAAENYANDWVAKRNAWRTKLAPVAPSGYPVLRGGEVSELVWQLQLFLNAHFPLYSQISPGPGPTSRYGPKSMAAVAEFQRRSGLTPDAVVGAKTWAALTKAGFR